MPHSQDFPVRQRSLRLGSVCSSCYRGSNLMGIRAGTGSVTGRRPTCAQRGKVGEQLNPQHHSTHISPFLWPCCACRQRSWHAHTTAASSSEQIPERQQVWISPAAARPHMFLCLLALLSQPERPSAPGTPCHPACPCVGSHEASPLSSLLSRPSLPPFPLSSLTLSYPPFFLPPPLLPVG